MLFADPSLQGPFAGLFEVFHLSIKPPVFVISALMGGLCVGTGRRQSRRAKVASGVTSLERDLVLCVSVSLLCFIVFELSDSPCHGNDSKIYSAYFVDKLLGSHVCTPWELPDDPVLSKWYVRQTAIPHSLQRS